MVGYEFFEHLVGSIGCVSNGQLMVLGDQIVTQAANMTTDPCPTSLNHLEDFHVWSTSSPSFRKLSATRDMGFSRWQWTHSPYAALPLSIVASSTSARFLVTGRGYTPRPVVEFSQVAESTIFAV